MMGGYRFKPKGDGDIDKNKHSHVAEALQYLMLHIHGASGGATIQQHREIRLALAGGWT